MPENRFFCRDPEGTIRGEEWQHLTRVMRKKVGDKVELIDGQGSLSLAMITSIGRDRAETKLLESTRHQKPKELQLLLALLKFPKLEWVVEKGVELGVTRFALFDGEKSTKIGLSTTQVGRLERKAISALKQSGGLYLPRIEFFPSIQEVPLGKVPLYIASLAQKGVSPRKCPPAAIAIGPESGWSDAEEAHLLEMGAEAIRLHDNTLRAETAAICAAFNFSS